MARKYIEPGSKSTVDSKLETGNASDADSEPESLDDSELKDGLEDQELDEGVLPINKENNEEGNNCGGVVKGDETPAEKVDAKSKEKSEKSKDKQAGIIVEKNESCGGGATGKNDSSQAAEMDQTKKRKRGVKTKEEEEIDALVKDIEAVSEADAKTASRKKSKNNSKAAKKDAGKKVGDEREDEMAASKQKKKNKKKDDGNNNGDLVNDMLQRGDRQMGGKDESNKTGQKNVGNGGDRNGHKKREVDGARAQDDAKARSHSPNKIRKTKKNAETKEDDLQKSKPEANADTISDPKLKGIKTGNKAVPRKPRNICADCIKYGEDKCSAGVDGENQKRKRRKKKNKSAEKSTVSKNANLDESTSKDDDLIEMEKKITRGLPWKHKNSPTKRTVEPSFEENGKTANVKILQRNPEREVNRVDMMYSRLSPQQNITKAIKSDQTQSNDEHSTTKGLASCTEPRSVQNTTQPELVVQDGVGITSVNTILGVESGTTTTQNATSFQGGYNQAGCNQRPPNPAGIHPAFNGAFNNPAMPAAGAGLGALGYVPRHPAFPHTDFGYINRNVPNWENIYYLQNFNWGMREDTDWAFIYLDTSSDESDSGGEILEYYEDDLELSDDEFERRMDRDAVAARANAGIERNNGKEDIAVGGIEENKSVQRPPMFIPPQLRLPEIGTLLNKEGTKNVGHENPPGDRKIRNERFQIQNPAYNANASCPDVQVRDCDQAKPLPVQVPEKCEFKAPALHPIYTLTNPHFVRNEVERIQNKIKLDKEAENLCMPHGDGQIKTYLTQSEKTELDLLKGKEKNSDETNEVGKDMKDKGRINMEEKAPEVDEVRMVFESVDEQNAEDKILPVKENASNVTSETVVSVSEFSHVDISKEIEKPGFDDDSFRSESTMTPDCNEQSMNDSLNSTLSAEETAMIESSTEGNASDQLEAVTHDERSIKNDSNENNESKFEINSNKDDCVTEEIVDEEYVKVTKVESNGNQQHVDCEHSSTDNKENEIEKVESNRNEKDGNNRSESESVWNTNDNNRHCVKHSSDCSKAGDNDGSKEPCKCFTDDLKQQSESTTKTIASNGFGDSLPHTIEKVLEGIESFHEKHAMLAKQKLDKVCDEAFLDYDMCTELDMNEATVMCVERVEEVNTTYEKDVTSGHEDKVGDRLVSNGEKVKSIISENNVECSEMEKHVSMVTSEEVDKTNNGLVSEEINTNTESLKVQEEMASDAGSSELVETTKQDNVDVSPEVAMQNETGQVRPSEMETLDANHDLTNELTSQSEDTRPTDSITAPKNTNGISNIVQNDTSNGTQSDTFPNTSVQDSGTDGNVIVSVDSNKSGEIEIAMRVSHENEITSETQDEMKSSSNPETFHDKKEKANDSSKVECSEDSILDRNFDKIGTRVENPAPVTLRDWEKSKGFSKGVKKPRVENQCWKKIFRERAIETLEQEAAIARDDVEVTFKKYGSVVDCVINLEPDTNKTEDNSDSKNHQGSNDPKESDRIVNNPKRVPNEVRAKVRNDDSVFKKPLSVPRISRRARENMQIIPPVPMNENPEERDARLREKAILSQQFRKRLSEMKSNRRKSKREKQEKYTSNPGGSGENGLYNKDDLADLINRRIAEISCMSQENEKEIRHIQRVLGRCDFPKDANGKVLPHCLHCGRVGTLLRRCVRCETAKYCCKACQRANYPEHKDRCLRLKKWTDIQTHIPAKINELMARCLMKVIRRFKLIPDPWMDPTHLYSPEGCSRAVLARVVSPLFLHGKLSASIEDMAGDASTMTFMTSNYDYYQPGPSCPTTLTRRRRKKWKTTLPFTAHPIPLLRCLQPDMFVIILGASWHRYPDNEVGIAIYTMAQIYFLDHFCATKLNDGLEEEEEEEEEEDGEEEVFEEGTAV